MARSPLRQSADLTPNVGARLAALRRERGLTLGELARRTGVSESTLSRAEHGASALNANTLFVLARELAVDIAEFFRADTAPFRPGARSVSRRGAGPVRTSPRYSYEVLCGDLARKRMHPAVNRIAARTVEETGGLQAHAGEEFLYVLSGAVEIHTETYAPLRLEAGDSTYFDATMAHAYVSAGEGDAELLVVTAGE